ncbi:MAG: glycosyltransferase family 4 protein, partial [Oryzihumus sp.]
MSGGHLHVLFVVTNYPPHRGGVEQHVSSLAHRLVARGAAATVVCLGEQDGVRDDEGVLVHTLRRRLDVGDVLALPEPLAWRRLAGSLADGATHVSTHTRFFPMSWLGLRLARRAGLPLVHTEHGSDHVRTPSAVVNAGALAVDRTMGRSVLRGATEVLAVSDRVADFVRRLSGRHAEVFGNGVDVASWRGTGPVEPAPRLVFVGRLVDEKGWRAFLDVAARLAGEVPGLTAVLAGDGPRRGAVEAQGRSHEQRGGGHVLGQVEHPQLGPPQPRG